MVSLLLLLISRQFSSTNWTWQTQILDSYATVELDHSGVVFTASRAIAYGLRTNLGTLAIQFDNTQFPAPWIDNLVQQDILHYRFPGVFTSSKNSSMRGPVKYVAIRTSTLVCTILLVLASSFIPKLIRRRSARTA